LYSPSINEFNSCPLGKLEYFNPEKFPSLSKTAIVGVLSTFTLASNSLFSPSLYEENFNFSGAIEAISFTASSIAKDSSIAGFLKTTISTGFSNLSTTATNCCLNSSSKKCSCSVATEVVFSSSFSSFSKLDLKFARLFFFTRFSFSIR